MNIKIVKKLWLVYPASHWAAIAAVIMFCLERPVISLICAVAALALNLWKLYLPGQNRKNSGRAAFYSAALLIFIIMVTLELIR